MAAVLAAMIVMFAVLVCFTGDESVTSTVKVMLPPVVGVPDSAPSTPRVRPAGGVPVASAQLFSLVPPPAANVTSE